MSVTRKHRLLFAMALLLTVLFLGQAKAEAAVKTMPAKVTSSKKFGTKVTWKKMKDAERYEIWLSECNGLEQYTKVASVKKGKKSYKLTNLSDEVCYKLRVYAKKNGKKIASSKLLHFVTAGNTAYTNIKEVTLNKSSVTIEAGKKKKVTATFKRANDNKKLLGNEHVTNKIRYFSSNRKIATVNSSGRISAKKAGTCTIYAIATNGVWDSVKVTVSKKASKTKKKTPSTPAEQPTLSGSAGSTPSTPSTSSTPAEEKFVLSYSFTGSVPKGVNPPKSLKLSKGDKITAASVTAPEGYTFGGWSVAGGGSVPATMPAEDVALIGYFEKKTYTLTVKHEYVGEAQKGEVPAAYADEEKTEYEYGEKIKLATPSAKGYVFVGWKETVPSKMPAKDVTVTGQWKKLFTLTYFLYMTDRMDGNTPRGMGGNTLVGTKTQELVEGEHALSELYTIDDFSVSYLYGMQMAGAGFDLLLDNFGPEYAQQYVGWYLTPSMPAISTNAVERYPLFQALAEFSRQAESEYVEKFVEVIGELELHYEGPEINSNMSYSELCKAFNTWKRNAYEINDVETVINAITDYDTWKDFYNAIEEQRIKIMNEHFTGYAGNPPGEGYPPYGDGPSTDADGNELPVFDYSKFNLTEDLTLFGFCTMVEMDLNTPGSVEY